MAALKLPGPRVAVAISAVLAALSAGSVVTYLTWGREADPLATANTLSYLVAPLVMASFGALLTSRRPDNVIGWLFNVAAAGLDLEVVPQAYTFAAAAARPHPPLFEAAVIMQGAFWPAHLPASVLLFLLFPSGRALSRRWAIAGAVAVAAPFALIVISLFVPGPIGSYEDVRMPFALSGDAADAFDAVTGPLVVALFLGPLLISTACLILRFRRSRGIERAQMKWLTFSGVVIVATQILSLSGAFGLWGNILSGLAFVSLPVSIAFAVLRYRLYDIDVLIRRTLIYVGVLVVLAAAYLGVIALTQSLLAPFTAGNSVAVAISTLAVVALFQPVQRRIRSIVDRRFYRAKYDAERTLDEFSSRLRDELDLRALERELLGAVNETVQPARASVWLRGTR